MEHFRYIDVIRNPSGKLRSYEEYNILERYERLCDLERDINSKGFRAVKIKDLEYEKRK